MCIYAMKTVEIICPTCKKKVQKPKNRVNWNNKRGKPTFCSRSCVAVYTNKRGARGMARRNELTPFSWFMPQMKRRELKKGRKLQLTKVDLFEQWRRQKGICPYTGWLLALPHSGNGWSPWRDGNYVPTKRDARHASLDRIESSKGYVKGNIQFISLMANYAKSDFPESDFIEMCRAVARHRVA